MACHLPSDRVQEKIINHAAIFGGNSRQLYGKQTEICRQTSIVDKIFN